MTTLSETSVIINDVGPRDGLQNQPQILSVDQRLQLIQALVEAGLKHIEVGAFVSPRAVPAMAGTDRLAALLPEAGVNYTALIPNRRGYDLARQAGVGAVALVVAASNTMNEKNIRMTTEAAMRACADVLAQSRIDGMTTQAYVATAWQCPFEGIMDAGVVAELSGRLLEMGATEIVIADTIGAAHPGQVRALMDRLAGEYGAQAFSCHFHDTRALGLANAYAALESGIRRFDASIGGLGGCPFAPGATGNIATEDLAMMLAMMGFETGIDMEKLLAAGRLAGELTGTPTGGRAATWLSGHWAQLPGEQLPGVR